MSTNNTSIQALTEILGAAMRRPHAAHPAWDRALRKAMGCSKHLKTQTALARRSGVAQSTIGRILRGEVNPRSGILNRLARALGMPLTALAYMAEDAGMQAAPAIVSERVPPPISTEELHHALLQALACRDDLRRGEQALGSLRRKENNAIERLKQLVRAQGAMESSSDCTGRVAS